MFCNLLYSDFDSTITINFVFTFCNRNELQMLINVKRCSMSTSSKDLLTTRSSINRVLYVLKKTVPQYFLHILI